MKKERYFHHAESDCLMRVPECDNAFAESMLVDTVDEISKETYEHWLAIYEGHETVIDPVAASLFQKLEPIQQKLKQLNGINQNPHNVLSQVDIDYFEEKVMQAFVELNDWYQETLVAVKKLQMPPGQPKEE